jgi:hypothetical protein
MRAFLIEEVGSSPDASGLLLATTKLSEMRAFFDLRGRQFPRRFGAAPRYYKALRNEGFF